MQEGGNTSHGAKSSRVAKLDKAILKESSECATRNAGGTANEVDPSKVAVKSIGSRGNVLKHVCQLLNQSHGGRLSGVESRDQTAEVDACSNAEGHGHVLGELLRRKATVGVEGHLGTCISHLSQANLLAEGRYMLAESEVIHAVLLERLKTGDLRNEVHDSVVTSHKLAISDHAVEIKLLHQADSSLEVLVPRNVQQAVIVSADDRLEEDETKSSLENLLVVLVLLKRLAKSPDGGIAVAHDIVVKVLIGGVGVRLEVLGSNTQAAVKVGAVGLKSRKNEVRAD
ncbi:hypothetical protein HG531_011921 [Fusarium graminearum]|nr:hypothetical protein HG531_011921 [Fusarium graminearum]